MEKRKGFQTGAIVTLDSRDTVSFYLALLFREMWRKRYREEREHSEYVDIGGES